MIKLVSIQRKLAEAIKNCGLTQTELASQLGVSQQTVSSYIHKNKLPALETFANICSVLDLDANDLLCINE